MSTAPTIPNAASLALSREWFAFFSSLLAFAAGQNGRIAALESRLSALEDRFAKKGV